MAYLDEVELDSSEIASLSTEQDGKDFVKRIVWSLYELFQDRTVTLKKWGIGFSFKISQIRPVIVVLVGEK